MLDLSKPYGVHEDILFYGDHEQENIVYYLPNEVGLAPLISDDDNQDKAYDFFLQIFKEGRAIQGGLKELEDSSGAIMSLGVQCIANAERLEKARTKLIEEHKLQEDFIFTPPEWKDGSIDLIVLDSTTQNEDSITEESFVDSIIGSNKPSLSSSDLKAVFNVRLDRKGASLLAATLQGDRSSVAGVLYDLKMKAMRPALDMTIEADLDRCHTKVSHMVAAGAAIKYGELTVSAKAEFEFIKEKLIEEGDIKVNIISQVTTPEMKQMVDDMVKEFTDKVMRELFSPYVSPELPDINLPEGVNPTPGDGILIGVAYKFQKKKLFHNKRIFVDYRERSTTLKTHNPQAHLWLLGNQIKDDIENYTQTVTFGDLWRENHLKTKILHDFEAEHNDLLSAEVLIWRKKDGKKELSKTGGFAIPNDAIPLISYTVTEVDQEEHEIAWTTEPDEPSGYYYQVKFTYRDDIDNVSTPVNIFSKVIYSSSQDLILIPQVLAPLRIFNFKYGNIDKDKVRGIDIYLRAKDQEGSQISQEILTLSNDNKEEFWRVRNHPHDIASLEEERHFHFADGRPSLKQNAVALIDEELILADPFEFKKVAVIPVITGNTDDFLEILLQMNYTATSGDFEFSQLFRAKMPDFALDEITIPVLEKGDAVDYTFTGITKDGDLVDLETGQTRGGALLLKIKEKAPDNGITIIWDGPELETEDLDYVRIEFKLKKEDGTKVKLDRVEFTSDETPQPITYIVAEQGELSMRVVKRYINGSKDKGKYKTVTTKELIIKP